MLTLFTTLFILSAAMMAALLGRRMPQARTAVVVKNISNPQMNVPVFAVMNAAAAQAGNIFFRLTEKLLRKFKVLALKLDNTATSWIHKSREKSKNLSLRYHDWRMQKHGFPKISFDSSLVTEIEDWFDGFFHRYFRRGVGYDRTTVRDDLAPREKVLVAAILADPKNIAAYRELGLFYFEQGNMFDALSAFEAIRKIDPTNSEAADRVAHIKEAMGLTE